jgi:large subunit ribosomal protein L25
MKLTMMKRSASKKSELSQIRRSGSIPAVLYSRGQAGENVAVDGAEFKAILRRVKSGCLSTTIFTLTDEHGKQRRAILKDIQYLPTTYDVWHLDFEELFDDVSINIKIPVVCVGVVDCVGIKLGGVLRQVIRTLRVNCLPKHIPAEFELDIRELAIGQTKRLSEITIPKDVRPLADLNEVAVVIAKR